MRKREELHLPSTTASEPEIGQHLIGVGQSAERGGGSGSGAAQWGLNDGGGAAGGAVRGGRGAVAVRSACGTPSGEGPVVPSRLRPGALRVLHPGVLLPVGAWLGLVEPVLGGDSALNVPNGAIGLLFYLLQGLLGTCRGRAAAVTLLGTSVASALASLWLGAVLLFGLRDLCVVCLSTYGVNLALLGLNLRRWKRGKAHKNEGKSAKTE